MGVEVTTVGTQNGSGGRSRRTHPLIVELDVHSAEVAGDDQRLGVDQGLALQRVGLAARALVADRQQAGREPGSGEGAGGDGAADGDRAVLAGLAQRHGGVRGVEAGAGRPV